MSGAIRAVLLCALVVGGGDLASAQARRPSPAVSTALVVRIDATFSGSAGEGGAGVIVGFDATNVYIATARHVVAPGDSAPYQIADVTRVTFFPGTDTVGVAGRIMVLDSAYLARAHRMVAAAQRTGDASAIAAAVAQLATDRDRIAGADLALVTVPRPRSGVIAALTAQQMDLLGDPRALAFGDPVSPMGCPSGTCWEVPAAPDRAIGLLPSQLLFQSSFVRPGSSGGALFNEWWEVLGIVTDRSPPTAVALPMTDVVELLAQSNVPVLLRAPRYPRSGYHVVAEMTFVGGMNQAAVPDSIGNPGRPPSSRVAFTRRGNSPWSMHGSLVRLAPVNLTINALMGGAGYLLYRDRYSLEPFVDFGLGRVESRYDAGGYHALGTSVVPARYVPLWKHEHQDGIGIGGGVELGYLLKPHLRVAAIAGRWSFGLTQHPPVLPALFIGGGLRWER